MAYFSLLSTKGGRWTRRVFQKILRKGGVLSVENASILKTYRFLHWNRNTREYVGPSVIRFEYFSRHVRFKSNNGFSLRPKTIEFVLKNLSSDLKQLIRQIYTCLGRTAKTLMKNESLDCPKRLGNTFKFPNPGVILHCPLPTQTTREFDSQNLCKTIITRFDEVNEPPDHKTRRLR